MRLFRLLLRLRRKRDPSILLLIQERDYLRGQVLELQTRPIPEAAERDYLRMQVALLQVQIHELQERPTVEAFQQLQISAESWRAMVEELKTHIVDTNDRLLVREKVYRAPDPNAPKPVIDPLAHETNEEWEARREQEEIDEHAARALKDPMFRMEVESAAEFDPQWARVAARMEQLR